MGRAVKNCTKCGEEKALADFYRHGAMADGHLSSCKACVKAQVRNHRADNIERIREYDRARSSLPHRVAKRKEIVKAQPPERTKARNAVSNAIRDGRLNKKPCAFCGHAQTVEAHHHDYSKPLDVTWLCKPCHRKFHGLERMTTYTDKQGMAA